ncbi:hypothetical protein [Bacillus sp. EB01]|uniref:hypothetical protein n=1 Tax=Bacillus sp. EB01 TaxID=1347086 RepID=UPI000693B4E5|nr:hypothetical protein [Bacillus sp. EB01]
MVVRVIIGKTDRQRTTKGRFFNRFKMLNYPEKAFIIGVLFFDIIVFLFSTQDYYFSFLISTGVMIPALLILTAICIMLIDLKLIKFAIPFITLLILPPMALLWLFHSNLNYSYETVISPTEDETILIQHRNATLGETNHFYNFYRKTTYPGLMKKVNHDTVHIMTRGTAADNLAVFGVDDAEWVKGEYVTFRSRYAETKVELK